MKAEGAAPLLRVRDLSVTLPRGADRRFAVEEASFELSGGEILCVVGEFGIGQIRLVGRHHGSRAGGT